MPEELNTTIEVLSVSDDQSHCKFLVSPLERGYGTTLGNSLRRVLLSTLPGSAIAKIKIEGVLHEFSTIKGVVEDVSEIILNLKDIALVKRTKENVTLVLECNGPKDVKASDISEDADIEIINKDKHICTINEEGKIYMELEVIDGKGYSVSDNHKSDKDPIGTIPIDASFTPVEKVNFAVKDTRVGQVIDYDELTVEVWTNGTVSAKEITAKAAKIIIDNLSLFLDLPNIHSSEDEAKSGDEEIEKILSTNIEDLKLSLRSFNCLKRAGIHTVEDIVNNTYEEMSKIKNFGKKSLQEVEEKLNDLGLGFKEE